MKTPSPMILACVSALAAALAYLPSLANGFVNLDDYAYVTSLSSLRLSDVVDLFKSWREGYQPLSLLSLSAPTLLFGLDPAFQHLINYALHIANVLLVFLLAFRLLKSKGAAFVTSLVFAVHPVNAEAVAWIASRKDVLYAFFYLCGLVAYVRYIKKASPVGYLVVLLFFILSALSKGMAVSFPLCLIAVDYLFERRLLSLRVILEKAPFLVLALAFGLASIAAQRSSDYMTELGTIQPLLSRLAYAVMAFGMYVGNTISAGWLCTFHPYPSSPTQALELGYGWVVPVAVVGVILAAILARRSRKMVFCALVFGISLIFALQLVPVANFLVADRYAYLACVGAAMAVAVLFDGIAATFPRSRYLAWVLLTLLVCVAGVTSFSRSGVWRDSVSMWNDALRDYPDDVFALNMRAGAMADNGNAAAALADLSRAAAQNPRYCETFMNRAAIRFNTGDYEGAIADSDVALGLRRDNPLALNNRGMAKLKLGDVGGAIADYDAAIASGRDRYAVFMFKGNMAEALLAAGNALSAEEYADAAIRLRPMYGRAYYLRARARLVMGRFKDAATDMLEAGQRMKPDAEVRFVDGLALAGSGEFEKAVLALDAGIELDPSNIHARAFKLLCLLLSGRIELFSGASEPGP